MSAALDDARAGGAEGDASLGGRARSPYTGSEKVRRVLWMFVGRPVFRVSFHNWYGLRAFVLRVFGARIARRVRVRPSVMIEQPWNLSVGENTAIGDRAILYCLGPVTIGSHVTVSQGAHLCAGTHDYRRPDMPLLRPPVSIGDHAWIAAEAFVGPGVTVGEGAVLGARGVAMRDLDAWGVYGAPGVSRVGERARAVVAGGPGDDGGSR
jgi:putative colanic acid biosynthesis acetyltransferase WcaF